MKKFYAVFRAVLCAMLSSVFFVSAIFLSDIISWNSTGLGFVFSSFMAVIYGITFISRSKKEYFAKWILSLPLSYLCLQYFWATHYAIRSLNWVFPNYGDQSAGGKFAGGVMLYSFVIRCIIVLAFAFFITPLNKSSKLEKIQLCLCSIFGIMTVAAVIMLEQKFPLYGHILG